MKLIRLLLVSKEARLVVVVLLAALLKSTATSMQISSTTMDADPAYFPFGLELVLAPVYIASHAETNVTVLNSKELPRKGYLVTTTQAWSVLVPSQLEPTSKQANNHSCFLATNGGPYNPDGSCVGAAIVDGVVVNDAPFGTGVGFGITNAHYPHHPEQWVIGRVASAEQAQELRLDQYVTGFDWLVYNGTDISGSRNNTTGAYKAPRTAVGFDSQGRLMLLVADGCQKCLRRRGPTLSQLATVLVNAGAVYAINMDGGGSSTLVQQGKVRNHATCVDLPIRCERAVASVMCIKKTSDRK